MVGWVGGWVRASARVDSFSRVTERGARAHVLSLVPSGQKDWKRWKEEGGVLASRRCRPTDEKNSGERCRCPCDSSSKEKIKMDAQRERF